MPGAHQATIQEHCAKLGIGLPVQRKLLVEFRRDHGPDAERQLARYLERRWRESRDNNRFLARQQGNYNPAQYVTSQLAALPDEPEAVPEAYQQEISKRAREQFALLRHEETQRRDLDRLVNRARDLAKRAREGTDFSALIHAMQTEITSLERKIAA